MRGIHVVFRASMLLKTSAMLMRASFRLANKGASVFGIEADEEGCRPQRIARQVFAASRIAENMLVQNVP